MPIAASAAAQRYVSGKVLDADNGPLAGATVFVKENRAIGMTTDAEGNYRLRLPDGKCAALCHVGDYLSIGRSYQKLLSFCADNGLEIVSDSYEFCINDYLTSHDENEYITKIVFNVQ